MLASLYDLPVEENKVAYLISNRVANYVIESIPNAFVTGGRAESNPAYGGSSRFFDASNAPWLDANDIEFLQTYDVDYLVLPADNTRIPQMLLQPERFEWLVQLARGDSEAARALLRPAADADWVRTRATLQRERWTAEANAAARLYHALSQTGS